MLKNLSGNVIGAVYIFISALMYATLPIFTKMAYATGLQPYYLLWLRNLFAFTFLAVLLLFLKRKVITFSPLVILQGAFFIAGGVFFFLSLQYLSAGLCSVIFFIYPVIVSILAQLFFKEKLTHRVLAGLILAVAGILMISGIVGNNDVSISSRGITYAFLACLIYACYLLIGQKNVASGSPLAMASTFTLVGIILIPILFSQTQGFFTPLNSVQFIITVAIAMLSTVIPIICLFYGVKKIGASRGALISSVEPALTIIIAYLVLGETMTALQIAGSALVLTSMILALPSQPKDSSKNRL